MFNRPDLRITEYEDTSIRDQEHHRFISFEGSYHVYWILPTHGGVPRRGGWQRPDHINNINNQVCDLIRDATNKADERAKDEFARRHLPKEDE